MSKTKAQQRMMVWIISAVIVGLVIGYSAGRAKYKPQISDLTNQVNQMKMKMEQMKAGMTISPSTAPSGNGMMKY